MKQVPKEDRIKILTLNELGYSKHEIARYVNVAPSTVIRTIQRDQETSKSKDRKKSGCPRIFLANDEKEIIKLLDSNKGSTVTEIHANYINETNNQVSVETIRNTLKKNRFVF
ncbi:20516_t:CDS:1 [Cetraspora pellucida]|uniref:20516_t:CDS:1 n=1 Tax=Cetraspora pellucida TaxID=1433469 RepID=A0A9N9HY99_9GLOM|nr:20516_t:CDS:1 [Cetraspora pellucida]